MWSNHGFCAIVILGLAAVACVSAGHGHGGGHGGGHGQDHSAYQGYFQYANIPKYGAYEFGFNRGNANHHISRYEQAENWRFRTKVRWGDKYGGYGEHYYDYNHVDKGGQKGKGHGHEQQSYGHGQDHYQPPQQHYQQPQHGGWHQGSYSELNPRVAPQKKYQKPNSRLPVPASTNLIA